MSNSHIPKTQNGRGLILTLLVTLHAICGAYAAPAPRPSPTLTPCEVCYAKDDELTAYVESESQYKSLLARNQKYLAQVQNDTSKAIKVKSNILIIVVKLETLKNNIDATRIEVQTKGCTECLKKRIQKQ